ncbi:hypothetical protein GOP47_0023052 [Adiantum capillus-veneris]|uniref:t-SNARE coiled-coil homology domain-containing protein n=1 Tax=Adiantum capillus-veneris TaxID=13818 RepID=A0A9D4Z4W0_ADICA|nr:hypothetical protein GOP47_0023052 [Adiantum capillus-veneris]
MNDLLPKSLKKGEVTVEYVDLKKLEAGADLEMGLQGGGEQQSLAIFFEEVSAVKTEMAKVQELLGRLQKGVEESKGAHRAQAMKEVRERMEGDVREVLLKARAIKAQVEDLDASNAGARKIAGCGPGTPSDRTRTSITHALRKKLKQLMEEFQSLREKARNEYRETVKRRFYTVKGQMPDEETVERIIETGESESFVQKAIQEQGRGELDQSSSFLVEIRERHDAAMELERSLVELHQIFLDMAVMVEAQGERLDEIEHYVRQASAYMDSGAEQLKSAKHYQRSSRKWLMLALLILLLLVVLLVIVPVATTAFKSS